MIGRDNGEVQSPGFKCKGIQGTIETNQTVIEVGKHRKQNQYEIEQNTYCTSK